MRGEGLRTIETDLLVVGSGGAGLWAAIRAAEAGARTLLVDKGLVGRSGNTVMASGLSVVGPWHLPGDGPEVLLHDTLEGGQFLNNQKLVRILIDETPKRVAELEAWGLTFDRQEDGRCVLLQSGGHRYPRVLVRSDRVGLAIAKTLRRRALQVGVKCQEDTIVTALLTSGERVVGATAIDSRLGEFVVFAAKAVVLATGGIAQLYPMSTSMASNSGDGVALALRAGTVTVDMEQVQFFPICLVFPSSVKGFALGLRDKLVNRLGERFMERYDPERMEGSTRDIMSRAIYSEIKAGRGTEHGGVFHDVREAPERLFVSYLDQYNFCLKRGLDLKKEMAEVAPAVHYFMGGIEINDGGETNLAGLYAAGEVAGGVHGANRLGGNSLADLLVFGARAGESAGRWGLGSQAAEVDPQQVKEQDQRIHSVLEGKNGGIRPIEVKRAIQEIMWEKVGVVRSRRSLTEALQRLNQLEKDLSQASVTCKGLLHNQELVSYLEAENLLLVGKAIATSALVREESRGAHYREDYPEKDDALWLKSVLLRLKRQEFRTSFRPVVEKSHG